MAAAIGAASFAIMTPAHAADPASGAAAWDDQAASASETSGDDRRAGDHAWSAVDGWSIKVVPAADREGSSDEPREALSLYSDAQNYMTLGAWSAAQRILEILVAKYPASDTARRARADLARMYTEIFDAGPAFSLGGPIAEPNVTTRPALTAPQRRGHAPTRQTAPSDNADDGGGFFDWFANVDPLQDQFRTEVGDRLFFAAHSAQLGSRGRDVLQAQIEWLKRHPDASVTVEAHADEPGDGSVNQRVSKLRADAIRSALVDAGLAPDRIRVVVEGRRARVALCETPACRAQNRRVVLKVAKAASK